MNTPAANSNRRSTTENPKEQQQPQQPQTAKEIIAANVKALIEQLEAGHSDALTAYLNAMKPFPSLQLRQCAGDCSADAHGHPCGRILGLEAARPLG
ncbi:hypothetical protein HDF12_002018 [Edaphobacter lichenicola]|uniref:Uncharacterized protein n=1 Tax=Tunturiibacter lichenicola TaxID=2051959 RepID=A0A7Y9NMT1_9BACT|nr:hypothetical protein [Edaphobacter lichenicola]